MDEEERDIMKALEVLEQDGYVERVKGDRFRLTNNGVGYARNLVLGKPAAAREFCRFFLKGPADDAKRRARFLSRMRRWFDRRFSDEEFAVILLGAVEYFDDLALEVARHIDQLARKAERR